MGRTCKRGIKNTDPTPDDSVEDQDAKESWLSLLGYDQCSWSASQDWPSNAPGFELVVDKAFADSLPGGVPLYNPFPWPLVVDEIRAQPGNTQMHLIATQIDRAVWDATYMFMVVAHLGPSPTRYDGWSYEPDHGVPAVGQVIPATMGAERTVISSLSRELSSRFADARILANPGFGASRLYNPTQPLAELADYHVLSPFDATLPDGKRIGIADGGLVRRPVPDPVDPSRIIGWDYRAVAPCANSPTGLIDLPDDIRYD